MFYEGSLQEGISTAVGQQKQVFCFVTNDNDESKTWENEFLYDPSIKDVLKKDSVCLRLEAGSDAAEYLAQIFPIPQTPTVVIMKHGELKEYIAAGTTKDEFIRRVQSAFNIATTAASPSPPVAATDSLPTAPVEASSAAVATETNRSEDVRRVLEERAAKMKAKEKQAAAAKKEAKKQAKPKAEGQVDARKHVEAELVKKRRVQEVEERKRILKRIEHDKEERRLWAAEREQQRNDLRSAEDNTTGPVSSIRQKKSEMTAIQVRLFDGSTIRSRFKSNSTVKDVRKWVDENRTDGRLPYTFKQLLTPLPSKTVGETEENKQLDETGLSPSSTLILIPVRNFASAYDDSSRGFFSRVMALLLGLITWMLSLVGLGGTPEPTPTGTTPPTQDKHALKPNSARDRRDQQLYNGNSLNFEPRPEEKDE